MQNYHGNPCRTITENRDRDLVPGNHQLYEVREEDHGNGANNIEPEKRYDVEIINAYHNSFSNDSRNKYCLAFDPFYIEGNEKDAQYGSIKPGTKNIYAFNQAVAASRLEGAGGATAVAVLDVGVVALLT